MSVKTNERELSGEIKNWFQNEIDRNNYPFKQCTNEPGLKSIGSTKFGDITLWKDRESKQAFTLIELKPPLGNTENLKTLEEKANTLKVKFAYTWDFRNLNVFELKNGKLIAAGTEPTPILEKIEDWLSGDKQALIKSYVNRFCNEFVKLEETGKFSKFYPDKIYFVNLLRETVNKLIPLFDLFIKEACFDKNKKALIEEYVVKQGIAYPNEEEYFKIIAKQRVYGFVTKVIFYLTIKRFFEDLPDLHQHNEDLNISIKTGFAKAREKDWQAVFEDGPIEELGIPQSSYEILILFFLELKVYHFGELPEDVIGELFQEIIDPDQRHTMGQYFTPEALVDFVIALVVNDPDGIYSDPTCGSGTFLIRLYDRLRYLKPGKKHSELLNQIWGFDIGKFPAELSTINLFRQDASNFENFPRVRAINIFDVYKGITFDFPPPNAGKMYFKIQEELPEINAFVGNFPFIRQELIEKKDKDFKKWLTSLIANEYLSKYKPLFELSKDVQKGSGNREGDQAFYSDKKKIKDWVARDKLALSLSSQADIYAYIFIHLTPLLASKGEFGIITSNSWMDAAYGSVLKQFFLDHFKIKTIVASWAEPWFEDAAVNCVITVLEREEDPEKRNNNTTNFVKLKKTFSELIPQSHEKFESQKRWQTLDAIVRTIDTTQFKDEKSQDINHINDSIRSFENGQMRIRMLNQKYLQNEITAKGEYSKWGKYHRADDVYFELIERCKEKLKPFKTFAEVKFGIKTGINPFFYLTPTSTENDSESQTITVKNSTGHIAVIEKEYLRKVIKSPRDSEKIVLDETFESDLLIFICTLSKEELRQKNHFNALNYINWGETQRNKDGVIYNEISSVKSRKYWYALKDNEAPEVIVPCGVGEIYKVFDNQAKVLSDKRLYEVSLKDINQKYFLNSSLYAFFLESESRVNLGDGLIDLTVYEVEELLSPILTNVDTCTLKALEKPYSKIANRKIKHIIDDIKEKDRQDLDNALLNYLGIEASKYQQRIYDSLVTMVNDRLRLPEMRKKNKIKAVKVSYDEIKSSVIKDCIPYGFKSFPDSFYEDKAKIEFEVFPTSGLELKLKEHFLGKYILEDTKKQIVLEVDSPNKCEYAILFSKANKGVYKISLPKEERVLYQLIAAYKAYKNNLIEQVKANAYQKLHNWSLAEKMALEILNM
jgi:hypothetical protein